LPAAKPIHFIAKLILIGGTAACRLTYLLALESDAKLNHNQVSLSVKNACAVVCVCVYLCVIERERVCVCVFVCIYVRERERECVCMLNFCVSV